jgi:hypothetical protein
MTPDFDLRGRVVVDLAARRRFLGRFLIGVVCLFHQWVISRED